MLDDYEFYPEAMCADASGAPCDKRTVGLFYRLHVTVARPPIFVGRNQTSSKTCKRVAP